jgi:hypothetical protein
MGGFFGVISKIGCVEEVFYGTDYHSHLGTKRAGLVFIVPGKGFRRSIHNLEKELAEYSDPDSVKYSNMVQQIARTLDLDTLIYQRLDDMIEAIGLPKEKLCTHCWDGSSYF